MSNLELSDAYHAAPFASDGELIGVALWRVSDLSPKWLSVCEKFLRDHGSVFSVSFGLTLSHIELKLTSHAGAGLGTFFVHGRIAISAVYLRGQNARVEHEVVRMFIESLKKSDTAQSDHAIAQPFESMATLEERPLHILVPWADVETTEQDERIVAELANHFAAAYLCRYEG